MEVEYISKEIIKPSSVDTHRQKPFKLSLFDQLLTPLNYFPIILFYQISDASHNISEISARLKTSLSETFSTFYFIAGRVKDNLYVDKYDEGVPFVEIYYPNISLSDFLQQPQRDMLTKFLPFAPFPTVRELETAPLLAIQLNTFKCGGISLGVNFLHKIFDGTSAAAFLKSWTNTHISLLSSISHLNPNLLEARMRFPPIESSLLTHNLSLKMDQLWSNEKVRRGKRFVFCAKAIATLREKARSKRVDNPSRFETISSFIWKFISAAARKISDSPKPSLVIHAVNIRHRITPPLPKDSFGNAVTMAIAAYDLANTDHMGLQDLVILTREAIANVNADSIKIFEGDKGHEAASQYVDHLQEGLSQEPEIFVFTSWLHMGFNDLEFGWGKPLWSGVLGGVSPAFTNAIIFKETGPNNEDLEAWVSLEETKMAILEADPEFLAFATPNPSILT